MKKFSFIASEGEIGKRLDFVLAKRYPEFSRNTWSKQFSTNSIKLSSQTAKSSTKLIPNEKVSGYFPLNTKSIKLIPAQQQPEVLFENSSIIVVNKPAGILTHGLENSSSPCVVASFANKISDPDPLRPGVVHRLDKDTSGVLILAKNLKTKQFLQAQFANRTVQKLYTALVVGRPKREHARLELPLQRSKKSPIKMAVSITGKPAISEYIIKKTYKNYSLVEISIHSGRTHQIRVHMSHIGHPVVGDVVYGNKKLPTGLKRQFLHAHKLTLQISAGNTKTFTAPLSPDLKEFLRVL